MRKLNLEGKKYGKLLVLKDVGRTKTGRVMWLCLCDCGGEKAIVSSAIVNGHVRSCGCLRAEAGLGNTNGLGSKRTPESRARTSKALKGKPKTPEHCANIRKSRTKEFREKMSLRVSGKNNPMYGKPVSEETRTKLSVAGMGNNRLLGHEHSPETIQKMSDAQRGKNHWNWKGGMTDQPYCEIFRDKDFRTMIMERDNHECQNPDCWGKSKKLCPHHINYVKKDCSPKNLITLCISCNARANKDREWHSAYYNTMLQEKYETNCVSGRM